MVLNIPDDQVNDLLSALSIIADTQSVMLSIVEQGVPYLNTLEVKNANLQHNYSATDVNCILQAEIDGLLQSAFTILGAAKFQDVAVSTINTIITSAVPTSDSSSDSGGS